MRRSGVFGLLVFVLVVAWIPSCLKRIDRPCPVVTGLVPAAAHGGDTVSIKGSDFLTGKSDLYTIKIGSQPVAPLDVQDANTIRFVVPVGIGDGPVSVSVDGSNCSAGNPPMFIYRLTVTDIKMLVGGFNLPAGMDIDANSNVILADRNNNMIKLVTPAGQITTIAGNGTAGYIGDKIPGLSANFNSPDDVAVDAAGNIYVADDLNHCIRKIQNTPTHYVSTVVGTIYSSGSNDGTPTSAKLTRPRGVAVVGSDSMFVVEYTISCLRYINFPNNSVNTLIGGGTTSALNGPIRVAFSRKRNGAFPILVADNGNSRVLEVNTNGTTNSPIILAFPPQDLALDDNGNILVLNRGGRRVSVVYKDNSIDDIAGLGINYTFMSPSGIAVDAKNKVFYVSDDRLNSIVVAKYQ